MINKSVKIVSNKLSDDDFTETELDLAPDGFFTEIFVLDVLETSPNDDILNKICTKLRKGGVLTLHGIDGLEFCRNVYVGNVDWETISNIIKNLNRFNSIVNLKSYFANQNWPIKFAGLDNNKYNITVIKS
jgi:hypothetical protein